MKFLAPGLILLFFTLFSSCGNDKSADKKPSVIDSSVTSRKDRDAKNYFRDCKILLAEAVRMDTILYQQMEVSKGLGNQAITAFTDFAYYCSNDSLSPVFLIKTAQVATAINNIPQAKMALEKCISDYPKFSNISAAMFLLARLYDEQTYLNNEEEAKRLYNEIIAKYPKSPEAESSKGALKYIGKSDKELMEELKKVTITTN